MKKRIGMILDVDFPPDDRPEKEAVSLIEAGHKLFLLCFTQSNKPLSENYRGIQITRFRLSTFLHNKLSAAYLVLPIYRWIWAYHIKKFIKLNQPDILHVHDLMLSDIAFKYAQKYALKVVCDQHEYWSNWISHTYHYNTPLGKIVNLFSNWKKYEQKYLQKADLVITVSENLREQYISEIKIDPQKIIIIPNTPAKKVFNLNNVDTKIPQKYASYFMLFYAGVIDILRGVDIIIKALPALKQDIPNIRLVLAGRLARGNQIFELTKILGVEPHVEFVGWLPINTLPSYIAASKICFFTPPAHKSKEINITIATKIYQYALMQKPIIVSQAKMMRQFVEENKLGLALAKYSEDDLTAKVKYIHDNYQEFSSKVAQNAIKLSAQGNIYWEQTVQPMVDNYDQFTH
jgi:glycosyltransferase involved in cell wall biosynthesis